MVRTRSRSWLLHPWGRAFLIATVALFAVFLMAGTVHGASAAATVSPDTGFDLPQDPDSLLDASSQSTAGQLTDTITDASSALGPLEAAVDDGAVDLGRALEPLQALTIDAPTDAIDPVRQNAGTAHADAIVRAGQASALIGAAAASGWGAWAALQHLAGLLASRGIAAPLFSRIQNKQLLDHEGRETLHDLVASEPGIGLMELSERSGLGWGTTVYHMERLESSGIVVSMKHGQSRLFFQNGHPAAGNKKAVAVLKNDSAEAIARLVMETPGVTQAEIAKTLGLGAPTVTKYVKRLEAEGLLETLPHGRTKLVQATDGLVTVMGRLHPDAPKVVPAMDLEQQLRHTLIGAADPPVPTAALGETLPLPTTGVGSRAPVPGMA